MKDTSKQRSCIGTQGSSALDVDAALVEWCQNVVHEVFLCADKVQLSNQLNLGAFF